ncbi:hypothetical protein NFI96_001289, partial [Prochilodus magdalenae]
MSRVCKKNPSFCTDEPLAQSQVCQRFTVLRQLLSSCYGPFGRLKQIHNNVGGRVLTTSTSAVLLKAVTFSDPLLKLIATSITEHTARFSDCGLFTGIFCIGLVENANRLQLGAQVASRVYRYLLKESIRYLTSEDCGCKVQVNFSSVQSLVALAYSVVTSKRACLLTPDEAEHVTSLTVQAFLQSIPCDSSGNPCFGRTVTVPVEGHPVRDSAVFSGLLVAVPALQSGDLQMLRPGPYKVVLFSASLSGDLSEIGEAMLEIYTGTNPEASILDQLLKLGEQTVRDGVGAIMVTSLHSPVPAKAYGQVGGLCLHRRGSKELLQLLPFGEPVISTMLLCHRNEIMLDELKVTCQKAEHILRLSLKEPYALLGGGCTETLLSAYIRYM